ncbi:Uma2 family endonuclease [Nocardia otitidiscaviarum]|uniref:Uma2 family endonuclease n=1 Tax=Nocardia otitidiscaviarum TaxID=1823 RepID=A0A516NSE3_9NOCA|nr:Uma2 family endonuclease [Nocardia otitidiscaviarum]MCP9621068.1 Uma2 family endonuclease [Nocardia otitidiscaviarum]QDP81827.1 Uma2 family endonuclease [Nocardia otitidiscaviarum]
MSAAVDFGAAFGRGPYTPGDLHNGPDEGKGYELWNGWLIEKMSPSLRHNRMSRGLRRLLTDAARQAGVPVLVDGGEYEFVFPASVRKPDVFVLDAAAEEAAVADDDLYLDPGDLLLVAEVVSPRSGSESHDRKVKRDEYAAAGIESYWIVDFRPVPQIEVLILERGRYRRDSLVAGDELLAVDRPFSISTTPARVFDLGRHDM